MGILNLKTLMAVILLLGIVQSNPLINQDMVLENPLPQNIDCGGACAVRCKLSSRPRLCHRACGTCCARCACVPPGTFGNYDVCPCYANMTTHDGKHKCP